MRLPFDSWTNTFKRLGYSKKKGKKAKRIKPRSHHFESLEQRQMLAVDLLNFQLYEDTGVADNVTTNPTVTAVVGTLPPGTDHVAVQFDYSGDQVAAPDLQNLISGDTVNYDPSNIHAAFPSEGAVTLLYRVLEQDAAGVTLETGDWQAFSFFVGDEAAATPQFNNDDGHAIYAFDVDEDAAMGTVVDTITATDLQGDAVTYALASWNENEPFAIDPNSGVITVSGALDYEYSSYYLDVFASDPYGNQATAYVSIFVQAVEENPQPTGEDGYGGGGYGESEYLDDESIVATFDILDLLPTLPSQAYAGDLIYFVPGGDQNTTTTTTDLIADSYFDEEGGLHEFDQTLNYTLAVTSTVLEDGSWSYQETLTSTYDIVTLDDTAEVDRWLHQWGFYNWSFIASGSLNSIDYSTVSEGSDSYQKTYATDWLDLNDDLSVDHESYSFTSGGSDDFYKFYESATTFSADGSFFTAYTEQGDGGGLSTYAGQGSYDTLAGSGDLSAGNGSESHQWGDWQESWSDSFGYLYVGAGTIIADSSLTQTKTGTRNETGSGLGTYSYASQGSYLRNRSYPGEEFDGETSISQEDNWSRSETKDYDYSYNDLKTYNSDGSYTIHIIESGDGSGSYDSAKDGTYSWIEDVGDLAEGDGWEDAYADLYNDTTWHNYQYDYDKDVTKTYTPGVESESAEYNVTKTGTYHETGNTDGGSLSTWSGNSTYDDAVPDGIFEYSEVSQEDNWAGSSSSNYDSLYDDLTTYANDGGKTYDVWETGGGASAYNSSGNGSYTWYWQDGMLLIGDGAEELYSELYTDVYADASTYDYTDELVWTTDSEGETTLAGTSNRVGGVSGSSTYSLGTAYAYEDEYPNTIVDGYSTVSRSDNTAVAWSDNWGHGYTDLTTYSSDGSYSVRVLESGDGGGSYDFSEDGNYAWIALAGDLTEGDGWKDTYSKSYNDAAWDTYQYDYDKDVTRTYTPVAESEADEDDESTESDLSEGDGYGGNASSDELPKYNVAKTGTYHETGSTAGGSLSNWSGNSTYADAVPSDFEFSELSVADNWQGSSSSNYDSLYDDLTTYNSDGSRQVNVIEFGGGRSTYAFAEDGTYTWGREFGDPLAGEGVIETYQDNYQETAWNSHDYDYQKNITTAYAAPASDESSSEDDLDENGDPLSSDDETYENTADDDSPAPSAIGLALQDLQFDDDVLDLLVKQLVADENATKTGTFHQTGSGASGSSYLTSGSSSYDGAVVANDVYREKVQSDQWSESFVENSAYQYDDLTTYTGDGSVSKQVQETGGGDSMWDSSASGTYWALAKTGELAAGDGWRETYSDSYDETVWDDDLYDYEIDTTATVTADLDWSKTGTREETGGGESGGLSSETVDTTYASASTYSDGQDSSSTADHYEKTWDYINDNLYNELITFQSDGGISYAWAEFGGGNGGWDWLASGDDLNQSTWSYDGTDYTDSRDDHRSDSGFETYDYDFDDDLTVSVAADGSESIGGGWQQWGGGEGNADLHHWGTSSWTEQYTGSGYSTSSFDENTYDIVSNDSYLHTFDHSGTYPDDSYGGTAYGGDTYVSGDYQDTSTSSGNWTETYDDDGYGGPGYTDGDSYSDSYTSNTSYDELLTDASPDFWYYGYGSEQYAFPGDFSDITAGAWDDAIELLTSITIEETDDEESTADEEDQTSPSEESSTGETAERSTGAFARDYRFGQTGEPGTYFVSAPSTPGDQLWDDVLRYLPKAGKSGVWKDADGNIIPESELYRGRPSDGTGIFHSKGNAKPLKFDKGLADFSFSDSIHRVKSGEHKGQRIIVEINASGTRNGDDVASLTQARERFGKGIPEGTWHHKSFDSRTGKFTMELVSSADHAPNHPGAYSDFMNWAADMISTGQYDELSDVQKRLINRAVLDPSNLKNINRKMAKGVEVVIEQSADAFAIVRKQGGKRWAIGGAMKLGGKWVLAPVKKALPVIGFFTAVGVATKTFAETGSYDAAFVAAGREVFMADVVEAPFKGLAEVLGNVTGLDERRPEGTPTIGEVMEENRKRVQEPDFDKRLGNDFMRILRALLP